jgi:hypothetical protein
LIENINKERQGKTEKDNLTDSIDRKTEKDRKIHRDIDFQDR